MLFSSPNEMMSALVAENLDPVTFPKLMLNDFRKRISDEEKFKDKTLEAKHQRWYRKFCDLDYIKHWMGQLVDDTKDMPLQSTDKVVEIKEMEPVQTDSKVFSLPRSHYAYIDEFLRDVDASVTKVCRPNLIKKRDHFPFSWSGLFVKERQERMHMEQVQYTMLGEWKTQLEFIDSLFGPKSTLVAMIELQQIMEDWTQTHSNRKHAVSISDLEGIKDDSIHYLTQYIQQMKSEYSHASSSSLAPLPSTNDRHTHTSSHSHTSQPLVSFHELNVGDIQSNPYTLVSMFDRHSHSRSTHKTSATDTENINTDLHDIHAPSNSTQSNKDRNASPLQPDVQQFLKQLERWYDDE
ncbi:hypothetical protein RFI_05330 [Reticulomyxa filosa]|uniref:Uncharacterized protein n=1 Tax=Reticulomyxa filosa TaxID=46433 RepID=X6P134_RETFI|nr:hypothetical protein RFI_05330 [Reticulomyxa filosa]|eukprot:ETO31789.1 hypothetical protein RFI_05330 [Reticulomyxa filosa]